MRLLDLFCGAGGSAAGYIRAGFSDVVGVDIAPQPRYRGDEFVCGDALDFAAQFGHTFDVIHASPPCQVYSRTRKILEGKGLTPRFTALIDPTRDLLRRIGKPYVIENVPGAPLIHPLRLSGPMFGLGVIRTRLFESSVLLLAPDIPDPQGGTNSHRGYSRGAKYVTVGGHNYNVSEGRIAMGIGWSFTREELNQAIPPAYTAFIGAQLLNFLTGLTDSA
jgi:DNA (cytosine-5)-methyltransferase 1